MKIDTELQNFGKENTTLYLEAYDKHSAILLKKIDKLINKHLLALEKTSNGCYNSSIEEKVNKDFL